MFVSFLMPHVDRGAGPLFHLIMLLQMSRFAPEDICFIGDDACFAEEHVPFGETLALGTIEFTCVDQERFRAYRKATIPFDAVAPLYAGGRSHLDAFRDLLTGVQAPLVTALGAALETLSVAPQEIEAFLTWANCPSLSSLAAGLGKPVIHNELGPFRGPSYQDTVYFDFQGVNGNTTPSTAWHDHAALAAELDGVALLPGGELRSLLYRGTVPEVQEAAPEETREEEQEDSQQEAQVESLEEAREEVPEAASEEAGEPAAEETSQEAPQDVAGAARRYAVGVALQVEDDSNTLAYGRGYDAIRLLYQALRNQAPEQVLVRSHPGARLAYRGGLGDTDASPSSLAFLQRIGHLLTINSSVAAEAALWNVPYTTLGDTPFSVMSRPLETSGDVGAAAPVLPDQGADAPLQPHEAEADSVPDPLLNALMLGYLVPSALLFDPEYYRWRIAGASLGACIARHLETLRRDIVDEGADSLPGLAGTEAALGAGVPHQNAALWSASRSLTRTIAALDVQVAALAQQLSAAISERDKNWEERCWFQTNLQSVEQEIEPLRTEHDTLRLAFAKLQGEADVLRQEMYIAREQSAAAQASVALALKAQLAAADAFTAEAQALRVRHGEMERAVVAQQARLDETFKAEAQALQARHGEMEQALAAVQHRLDALAGELGQSRIRQATAEAQSSALLDELHRTQRERIDALARGPMPGR